MKEKFQVLLMDEARVFILNQELKIQKKIAFNIQKAKLVSDPKVFKKLSRDIWEFRIKAPNREIRLLSFWDKRSNSYVICTHGFVKKTQKLPKKELDKAIALKDDYFKNLK